MKKYILNFLLIFTTVFVWATPENPYAHIAMYDNVDKSFLKNLITGKRTTYQICTPGFDEEENEENNILFLIGLSFWLKTTENFILERENGKKEFKDILKIIDNLGNLDNLERLPCQEIPVDNLSLLQLTADLNMIFTVNQKENVMGDYDFEHRLMRLNRYMHVDNDYYAVPILTTVLHELGHVFGLADKYSGTKHAGSYIYNSLTDRPSIMLAAGEGIEDLTCDDIDGFVTSLDRIRNKKRTFKSFCNDGIVLVNGKADFIKGGYVYNYKDYFSYDQANYDADITVTYEDKSTSKKTYILDMTLQNFDKEKGTLNFLKSMGFNTENINLKQNIEVRIHAPVKELPTGFRDPIGLTTLTLKVNGKTNQVVNMFYNSKNTSYIRTSVEPYKLEIIPTSLELPIMTYAPERKFDKIIEDTIIKSLDDKDNYLEKYLYKGQK